MSGSHRSAVVIARVLGVEGYSDFVHNQVEQYWKKCIMDRNRDRNVARIERRFNKLVAELELDENERIILGKFISLRAQMSFDAGLRVGMQAMAHDNDHQIDNPWERSMAQVDGTASETVASGTAK